MSSSLEGIFPIHQENNFYNFESKKQITDTISLFQTLPFAEFDTPTKEFPSLTSLNFHLLQEVNNLLSTQENYIEKELAHLESHKKNQKLMDAFLETEQWGYSYIDTTKTTLHEGMEFLENVLPHPLLKYFSFFNEKEEVVFLSALGENLLSSLNLGCKGLSILYKGKILEYAKKEFERLQEKYEEKDLSEENVKMQKVLGEWKIDLDTEQEKLDQEKIEFSLEMTSHIFSTAKIPFEYSNSLVKIFSYSKSILAGLSFAISALEMISSSLSLNSSLNDIKTLKTWQKNHQLLLQPLDTLIHTSQDLLTKRNAIVKKKILLLEPDFAKIEPKIQELKKTSFNQSLQQIGEKLKNRNCSPLEIREIFNKWNLNGSNNEGCLLLEQWIQNQSEKNSQLQRKQNKQILNKFFHWLNHSAQKDKLFEEFYQTQSKETLLHFYIDHQETLEITTKNALKQMVNQKHEIEERFLNFRSSKAIIQLSVSCVALTISLTLAILGLLSIPFGGASVLLLFLLLGSTLTSLGLLGASYRQALKEKPATTRALFAGLQSQLIWANLQNSIHSYFHEAKEKKLLEIAKLLHRLHQNKSLDKQSEAYEKAFNAYQQAKLDFNNSLEKVIHWNHRLEELNQTLNKKNWEDFSYRASLQNNSDPAKFDTLRAFQEAFQACDLHLLSQETKALLEIQLGVDLETLQIAIQKNPDEIKEILQKFFILNDSELISFIQRQQARLTAKLIHDS